MLKLGWLQLSNYVTMLVNLPLKVLIANRSQISYSAVVVQIFIYNFIPMIRSGIC